MAPTPLLPRLAQDKGDAEQVAVRTAEKLLKVDHTPYHPNI